jgi:hypothetical protein
MRRVTTTLLASLVLLIAACGPVSIMRTGPLKNVLTLDDPAITFTIRYVKAGGRWTNVWIDMAAQAKQQDVNFDPNDFELFDPATHISYKPTMRSFISAAGMWGPMIPGGRNDGWGVGISAASTPTMIRAGSTVLLTLVFETPTGGVEHMMNADLVYHGVHLPLQNH